MSEYKITDNDLAKVIEELNEIIGREYGVLSFSKDDNELSWWRYGDKRLILKLERLKDE